MYNPSSDVVKFNMVYLRCSRCNCLTEHMVEDHRAKLHLFEAAMKEECRINPIQHYVCDVCGFCDDCEAF